MEADASRLPAGSRGTTARAEHQGVPCHTELESSPDASMVRRPVPEVQASRLRGAGSSRPGLAQRPPPSPWRGWWWPLPRPWPSMTLQSPACCFLAYAALRTLLACQRRRPHRNEFGTVAKTAVGRRDAARQGLIPFHQCCLAALTPTHMHQASRSAQCLAGGWAGGQSKAHCNPRTPALLAFPTPGGGSPSRTATPGRQRQARRRRRLLPPADPTSSLPHSLVPSAPG